MVKFKLIPSYYKCFSNSDFKSYKSISNATVLKNDVFAFEAVILSDEDNWFDIKTESDINGFIRVYRVREIYVDVPVKKDRFDDYYLNDRLPGMYPDLLMPVDSKHYVNAKKDKLASVWIEVSVPEDARAGRHEIKVILNDFDGKTVGAENISLDIIDALLPEQTLKYTQWFHPDCLASYYKIGVFSDRHWEIMENFVKTAVKNGINTLLMPVFTPPLDTKPGSERPTTQLVGVTKTENGYEFDFSLVEKWLAMCDRCGIKYYEMSHLFTQWGAEHAPKIMATVNGEYKKIFGWETDALSDEYIGFLKAFLTEFKQFMRRRNLLDKCHFHLSDEPAADHIEHFMKIRQALEDVISDIWCGEALSGYDFYKTGAVKHPIVSTEHIEPFIENKVPDLWCYYCCMEGIEVSNRFVSMPMNRTRVIAEQMYKYDIKGFLQWGYNFYYSYLSVTEVNPYECTDGTGGWVPAGDAFSVYPAPDGTAYETLHMKAFTQALRDMRAFELLEKLSSKEEVLSIIENGIEPVTFKKYPHEDGYCEGVRERINKAIAEKIR